MKRFHLHLAVDNLEEHVRFYSALFGAGPSVRKNDYAKWMLEDPRVNFAISTRAAKPGLDHLGVQVETDAELEEMHGRLPPRMRHPSSMKTPHAVTPARTNTGCRIRMA